MVERSADERIRTTEWEDIQYKHGNKVGKYIDGEFQIIAQRIADANPNLQLRAYDAQEERVRDKLARGGYDVEEGTTIEDLAEAAVDPSGRANDDDGTGLIDDDDDALAAFRRKRMAEMQKAQEGNVFGIVRRISGTDYVREITEASDHSRVVALMLKDGHADCDALLVILRQVASRHRDVKFVCLIATEAIPKFPDKQLPCVLLYHKRELVEQLTTLEPWGGKNLSLHEVEKRLSRSGFVVLEEDDGEDEADS
ncbi:MAG: hypothetical protein Q8J97_11025, partial [Flavobacteriaceae bacterium]|nr:hypothetical protein [Flavobacteriaceae bacterium]